MKANRPQAVFVAAATVGGGRGVDGGAPGSAVVLRFSGGWETTEPDWMQLLEGVIQVSEELARVAG